MNRFGSGPAAGLALLVSLASATGKWTPLKTAPPYPAYGAQILLSDGSVFFKTDHGPDAYGNQWVRLIPDDKGHYVNGTWSKTAPAMASTRIDFSSQLLKDGRVYVAGGEYGTGGSKVEVYDPVANAWTSIPWSNGSISDANLEILEDGRVMQSAVGSGTAMWLFDPAANSFTKGSGLVNGRYNEATWVKLRDNSILTVNTGSTTSERYIPSLSKWVADAKVPVSLFDPYGTETGPGFLLPNGKAIYFGSSGATALYTPSGSEAPGTWTAGTPIPNGYGQPDAIGFMLANGKILLAVTPPPTSDEHFPSPMYYFEYDYRTGGYEQVNAPGGGTSTRSPAYVTQGVDLPDGTIMYTQQVSSQVFIYTPDGAQLDSGKAVIEKAVAKVACKEYTLTGTLFNGISEGAVYGDDVQMNTNYPIARLTAADGTVHYGRTHDWNSTGVQRYGKKDTVSLTLPAGLPEAVYDLSISANGIVSDPIKLNTSCAVGLADAALPSPAGLGALRMTATADGLLLSFHWNAGPQAAPVRVRAVRADGVVALDTRVPAGDGEVRVPLAAGRRDVLFLQWIDGVHSETRKWIAP